MPSRHRREIITPPQAQSLALLHHHPAAFFQLLSLSSSLSRSCALISSSTTLIFLSASLHSSARTSHSATHTACFKFSQPKLPASSSSRLSSASSSSTFDGVGMVVFERVEGCELPLLVPFLRLYSLKACAAFLRASGLCAAAAKRSVRGRERERPLEDAEEEVAEAAAVE